VLLGHWTMKFWAAAGTVKSARTSANPHMTESGRLSQLAFMLCIDRFVRLLMV